MQSRIMIVWLLAAVMLLAACGNDNGDESGDSDTGQNNDTADSSAGSQNDSEAIPADYAFTIEFSTGSQMSAADEAASVDYREPRTNRVRAESGGIEFDTLVYDRTGEEIQVNGNKLRIYFAEGLAVGEVGVTEIFGQDVITDIEGTGLEPDQRVDCEAEDTEDITVTITQFDGNYISGSFEGITLDACRDASVGGVPIEGAALVVSGTFENIPFGTEE